MGTEELRSNGTGAGANQGSEGAIVLPWPPSINHYWRRSKNGMMHISAEGVAFREAVHWQVLQQCPLKSLQGDLSVDIEAFMPDRRRRDLDNILKALLDAITHAGVWMDDSQIVDLRIRKAKTIAGMVKVKILQASDKL